MSARYVVLTLLASGLLLVVLAGLPTVEGEGYPYPAPGLTKQAYIPLAMREPAGAPTATPTSPVTSTPTPAFTPTPTPIIVYGITATMQLEYAPSMRQYIGDQIVYVCVATDDWQWAIPNASVQLTYRWPEEQYGLIGYRERTQAMPPTGSDCWTATTIDVRNMQVITSMDLPVTVMADVYWEGLTTRTGESFRLID